MISFPKKLIFRRIIFLLSAAVLALIIFTAGINAFLGISKDSIERYINTSLNIGISFRSIKYCFPSQIILRGVKFSPGPFFKNRYFSLDSAGKIRIFFSLFRARGHKIITISRINFYSPKLSVYDYGFLSSPASVSLPEHLIFLSGNELIASFNNASFLVNKENKIRPLLFNAVFKIGADKLISSYGCLYFKGFLEGFSVLTGQNAVDFNFYGYLKESGVNIENIELKTGNFYSKLWGSVEKGDYRLSGIVLFDNPVKAVALSRGFSAITASRKDKGGYMAFGDHSPNIFDLDCFIKITDNGFKMDNLSFSVNKIPFRLKGEAVFSKETLIDFKLSSFPYELPPKRDKNPGALDAAVAGSITGGNYTGKVYFNIPQNIKNIQSLNSLECDFKNLSLSTTVSPGLKLFFEQGIFNYKLSPDALSGVKNCSINYSLAGQQVIFKNLIFFLDGRNKTARLHTDFYGGYLRAEALLGEGRGRIFKVCNVHIEGVDINDLAGVYGAFNNAGGKTSADIVLKGYPVYFVNMKSTTNKGWVKDTDFTNWLADFFIMPSFRKIDFDRFCADVVLGVKLKTLYRMDLASKDLSFRGDLKIDDGMASGLFSLKISKDFLAGSEKCRPLIGLLRKDAKDIGFDFRVSGRIGAINFKWLDSDFKNKLQKLLPAVMERSLEGQVEEAIKEIGG